MSITETPTRSRRKKMTTTLAIAIANYKRNNDTDDLRKRTKITLTDIHKLIELRLSTNYFLFDNRMRISENSGPIGVALIVVISEAFLQRLENRAKQKA